MKTLLKYALTSLAVCLCLSVVALPKGQTKKFRIQGHVEGHITHIFLDGSFTTEEVDIGESTFFGKHYNPYTSTYVPDGSGNYTLTFSGTFTPANAKGTIEWTGTGVSGPSGGSATITIVSGTGTLVGIQGSFTSIVSNSQSNPDGTLSYDYVGEGEVTFP